MAKNLVIVESPTKAKTISRYLGKDYEVKASGGHVRDLPEDKFGVDVEHGFEPTYRIMPGIRRRVGELKKSGAKADVVYLAPDPDREGEAIAWHLKTALDLPEEKVRRATFHEITREAVREAFKHTGSLNEDLVNAQQARRILDRIVGYELSPLISSKIVRGLSAGRVQSVALRLICDREAEILAFQIEEYWTILARLRRSGAGKEAVEFEAELKKLAGQKVKIPSEERAAEVVGLLKGRGCRVSSVQVATKLSRAAPPFITSTLQQAASSRLGFTTDRTMRIAQQLYEGIETAGGSEGLITYMRTDSTRVSGHALGTVRELIGGEFGAPYVPERPNRFKSPRAAQEAHEAIRPTDVTRTPQTLKDYLTKDQFRLYELIWQRFVASQMAPAVYEVTAVEIEAGEGLFAAGGRRMVFDGHLRVMPSDREEDKGLPALKQGDELDLVELVPQQHFTQPPARFTEAALVRELEKRGIGRPSTYAPTVSTLLKRNYVRRRRRTLWPSDLGIVVAQKLVAHFPREMDLGFTRDLEEKLDKIEEGQADWRETLDEFYGAFGSDLKKARAEMTAVSEDPQEHEQQCEKCGKGMILRFSRKGDKFLGCSGFPECDFTVSLKQEEDGAEEQSEHKCPKCGAPMLKRLGRRGRPYLACSGYPGCRMIMGLDKEGNPVELEPRTSTGLACPRCGVKMYARQGEERGGLRCPRCGNAVEFVTIQEAVGKMEESSGEGLAPCDECGGPMLLRRSKKGLFLGCANYPECKGTRKLTTAEAPAPVPTAEQCGNCGKPMVLRWGRFGPFLACSGFPRCRSSWQIPASMPPCPREGCEGRVMRKSPKDAEAVYGCTRWPECDYTTTEPPAKAPRGAAKRRGTAGKEKQRKKP